jgi:NTP pyrophosphatase (non-canonical NTP hydrolase)
MITKLQETLDLLQEECAEVIVEVSKCRRFGMNEVHTKTGLTHTEMLTNEIGDVLTLVDWLIDNQYITQESLDIAKQAKKDKLKIWSNIYGTN